MDERRIRYLDEISNILNSTVPSANYIIRYLREYCVGSQNVNRKNFRLSSGKFGCQALCLTCFTPWYSGRFTINIHSYKTRKNSIKKLLCKDPAKLNSFQRGLVDRFKLYGHNSMILTCLECKNVTKIGLLTSDNTVNKSKANLGKVLSNSSLPVNKMSTKEKKVKKKKKRDVFCGLKISAIAQIRGLKTPSKTDSKNDRIKSKLDRLINSSKHVTKNQSLGTIAIMRNRQELIGLIAKNTSKLDCNKPIARSNSQSKSNYNLSRAEKESTSLKNQFGTVSNSLVEFTKIESIDSIKPKLKEINSSIQTNFSLKSIIDNIKPSANNSEITVTNKTLKQSAKQPTGPIKRMKCQSFVLIKNSKMDKTIFNDEINPEFEHMKYKNLDERVNSVSGIEKNELNCSKVETNESKEQVKDESNDSNKRVDKVSTLNSINLESESEITVGNDRTKDGFNSVVKSSDNSHSVDSAKKENSKNSFSKKIPQPSDIQNKQLLKSTQNKSKLSSPSVTVGTLVNNNENSKLNNSKKSNPTPNISNSLNKKKKSKKKSKGKINNTNNNYGVFEENNCKNSLCFKDLLHLI